jgi:hypothetical protein
VSGRSIHAELRGWRVVRHNAKWYVERDDSRSVVTLAGAVSTARRIRAAGGNVYVGVPGGVLFDRALAR